MEADAPCVAGDHGADLQELEADGGALGAGVLAALEPQAPDCVHQSVGEAGEQQAELVGPPAVAGGAVGEELELLLLDAVLHLAAGAVEMVVEITALAREVGHHEARVGALGAVLETRDHAAHAVPGLGAVDEFGEAALLHAAALEQVSGLRHLGFCQAHQPGVYVVHGVALAPTSARTMTRRARLGAGARPRASRSCFAASMSHQQMVAGEDVERRNSDRSSRGRSGWPCTAFGVDITDLLRRRREGGDVDLDQNPVDGPGPGPLGPVLEATQSQRAGQHPVALGRRLQGQVTDLAQHVHKVPHLAALAIVCQPAGHRPAARSAWRNNSTPPLLVHRRCST